MLTFVGGCRWTAMDGTHVHTNGLLQGLQLFFLLSQMFFLFQVTAQLDRKLMLAMRRR